MFNRPLGDEFGARQSASRRAPRQPHPRRGRVAVLGGGAVVLTGARPVLPGRALSLALPLADAMVASAARGLRRVLIVCVAWDARGGSARAGQPQ